MTEEKQIEELAKDIIKTNIRISGLDYAMVEILNAETNKNYPFMQLAEKLYKADFRKQEWISVEERMPENLQEVLAYRGNHIGNLMNTYTYVGGDMWQDEYGFGCRQEDEGITHWMPLPEPPKMKGGAE